MAINKATLGKDVNGQIEYIYPKTSSDMVKYTTDSTETVKDKLDTIRDTFDATGGRNYILGTKYPGENDLGTARSYAITNYDYSIDCDYIPVGLNKYARLPISIPMDELNANADYFTFSCEIKAANLSSLDRSKIRFFLGTVDFNNYLVKYASRSLAASNLVKPENFSNDTWCKVIFTPVIPNQSYLTINGTSATGPAIKYTMSVELNSESDCDGPLYVRRMKLERGRYATDWSIAPEDVTSQVTKAVTTIKKYYDGNTDSIIDQLCDIKETTTGIINYDIPSLNTLLEGYNNNLVQRINSAVNVLSKADTDLESKIIQRAKSLRIGDTETIITPSDSVSSYLTVSNLGLDFGYLSEDNKALSVRQNAVSVNTNLVLGDYTLEIKTVKENGASTINIF